MQEQKDFDGHYIIALTDLNDNFKYNLTPAISKTLISIAPKLNSLKDIECIIPADVLPGMYRLRVMYQHYMSSGSQKWTPIDSGITPYFIPLTIEGSGSGQISYKLEVGEDVKTDNLVCGGLQSSATLHVKNTSNAEFKGYFILALTDEQDNFKYDLSYAADALRSIKPNSKLSYGTGIYVPDDVIPGTYRFRIMYKENISDQWKALTAGSYSTYQEMKIEDCNQNASCVENYEPNDSRLNAYPINLNTVYNAGIGKLKDYDYYKFTLSEKSNIVVTLQNLPKDYDLKLYNSSNRQIKSSLKRGIADEIITYNNLPSGTYYVMVYGYKSYDFDSERCYALKVASTTSKATGLGEYPIDTENNTSTIVLYPNPVKNTLYLTGINSNKEEYTEVTIIDRSGRIVKTSKVKVEHTIPINVSDLLPDVYYLHILGKNYKFIKK